MKQLLLALLLLFLTACSPEVVPDPPPEDEVLPPPTVEEPSTPNRVRVIDPDKPMVALTYDDGPHEVYTNQLLDIFEEYDAVATFFEIGKHLPRDPDSVRRAAEMGCEIGSHSYSHSKFEKITPEEVLADLEAADAAFEDVLGYAPTLLRPPYGSLNEALDTAGYSVVTWSVDPSDWKVKETGPVVEHIQNVKNLDGQVVLLHSLYESTVEATRILVPWLLEQGYQLVTVSELITHRFNDQLEANHV